jgi:hypothetical protein
MKFSLRLLYLYLFSFVGLIIVVFGSIQLVDLAITTYIFPDADNYYYQSAPRKVTEEGIMDEIDEEALRQQQEEDSRRNKQRRLANTVAMLVVGTPLYMYHWKTIQKEAKAGKRGLPPHRRIRTLRELGECGRHPCSDHGRPDSGRGHRARGDRPDRR